MSDTKPTQGGEWTPARILHLAEASEVEFAVRACNCHDDLVAAERESLNLCDHILDKFNWSDFPHLKKGVEAHRKRIAAALAKAGEK